MQRRKVILFELNEVPYRLIDYYCGTYPQSTIASLVQQSQQFETYADEPGVLTPTKTWPTVHRGVDYSRHGIESFGQPLDEIDQEFPPLWKLTTAQGVKTGVFGSLLTHQIPEELENYTFYVPEVFATEASTHPESLSSFQDFNLTMSRASARNVSQKVDWKSAGRFLAKSPSLGVTPKTFFEIGRQLVSEKLDANTKARRRTFQSILGFDIFMKQLRTGQSDFVTFFTNHVAATMHRYWAATFPQDYEDFSLSNEWVLAHQAEIDFAMQKTDEMLAHLIQFVDANPEYLLYVATSMGQAATTAEATESFLTIADLSKFMSRLGVERSEYEQRPAMAPHYSVVIAPHKLDRFRKLSSTLLINDQGIDFREHEEGFFHLDFMYQNYKGLPFVELEDSTVPFEEMGIANTRHEDGVYLTANHIPEGALLVYDPQRKEGDRRRTQISSLDIAPMILNTFSIPLPTYMQRPLKLYSPV